MAQEKLSSGNPLIFVVAGEPSGDALGANLMRGLKRLTGDAVRFAGVGGERMESEGLKSLFPMAELSIMGLVEVVPRIPRVFRRVRDTAAAVLHMQPAAVVTVDAPGFTFRVAKRLRAHAAPMPLVHYVAPQVWAWRAGKAKLAASLYDHLMVLLPFEPAYFEKEGLRTTYVGHPVTEFHGRGAGAGFRSRHGIAADAKLVGVMPGSRRGEIHRLLPIFGAAIEQLRARERGLHVVVPTVATVASEVATELSHWPVPSTVVRGDEKYDAFDACNAAVAASGTITLELAVADVPFVTAYRVSRLSAAIARRVIRVKYATMANILLDRPAVPEFLQEDCTPEKLAEALAALLGDPQVRQAQQAAFAGVRQHLQCNGSPPSERAAAAVLTTIADAMDQRAGLRPERP
jgi:lipid-A-disaccharide synthase